MNPARSRQRVHTHPRTSWRATGAAVIALAVLLVACGDSDEPSLSPPAGGDGTVTAVFDTPAGRFAAIVSDPESVTRLLEGETGTHVGIPNGRLMSGDGGVNAPHDWHLVDIEMADMTMEVCDGTVDYINELGREAFIEQHGDRFCPWEAVLISVTSN